MKRSLCGKHLIQLKPEHKAVTLNSGLCTICRWERRTRVNVKRSDDYYDGFRDGYRDAERGSSERAKSLIDVLKSVERGDMQPSEIKHVLTEYFISTARG